MKLLTYILPFIFSITICSLASSQERSVDFDIHLGPPFHVQYDDHPVRILGSSDSTYYLMYRKNDQGVYVRGFNHNLSDKQEIFNIEQGHENYSYRTFSASLWGDTLYHFSFLDLKEKQKYFLQKTPLNSHLIGKRQLIGEVLRDEKKAHNAMRLFVNSPNGSTKAFLHTVPNKALSPQRMRIVYLDSLFNIKTITEYTFPFKNKELIINSVKMSNDNEIIVLARMWLPSRLPADQKARTNHYKIFVLKEGKIRELNEFILEKRFLQPLGIKIVKNDIILSTCYSVKTEHAMKGTYYVRINLKSGEKLVEHRQGFDESYYTQLAVGEKRKRIVNQVQRKTFEDHPFTVFHVDIDTLKSAEIIAEQIHAESSFALTRYFTKDLAIVKLDSMGKQLWSTKIAKNNSGSASKTAYVHYFAANLGDRSIILYNGNRENLGLTIGKADKAFKKEHAAIMATVVNANGTYYRTAVLSQPELSGYRLIPNLSRWIDDDHIILYLESKRDVTKHRIAKLKVTEIR